MQKLKAVAIALLAALPVASLHLANPARADDTTFTLPPFHIGDFAAYTSTGRSGYANISIGEPVQIMDKSMHMTEVIPAALTPGDRVDYFSARTMTVEATYACGQASSTGDCSPLYAWEWYLQGSPAIWGATYLQGRSFQIGDSWNLTGECAECTWRRVSILTPNERSPAGTDFVASIQGDYSPNGFKGHIHMASSSPFPLLVEHDWGRVNSFLNMTTGTTPILPTFPPEDPSYTPLLPLTPFAEGRPVEGTPIPGWPSWSDARNVSGPDAADTTPGAQFVSISYPSPLYLYIDVPTRDYAALKQHQIEARFTIPGQPDSLTTYRGATATAEGLHAPMAYSQASTRQGTTTNLPPCEQRSVPIWDTVRTALKLPYLHAFEGVKLQAPLQEACRGRMTITGDSYTPPGEARVFEELEIELTSGYLLYATTIVRT